MGREDAVRVVFEVARAMVGPGAGKARRQGGQALPPPSAGATAASPTTQVAGIVEAQWAGSKNRS